MKPTFITSGDVEHICDVEGKTIGYKVGRKNSKTIRLSVVHPEYYSENHYVYIDQYGSAWIKK